MAEPTDAVDDERVAGDEEASGPTEAEWQLIEDEALADRRVSSIAAGRRKGGVVGAAMAGAMLALQEIYEGPAKDDGAIVTEAPGEPGDIDEDGITVSIGDVEVHAELPD